MTPSPIITDRTMLEVLVDPSSTHGLAEPESDKDVPSIFVTPETDTFRPSSSTIVPRH